MKSIVRRWQELTVRECGLSRRWASPPRDVRAIRAPVVVGQPLTLPSLNEYCAVAQKEIATSRVPGAQRAGRPTTRPSRAPRRPVKPLETLQFVGYADSQHTRPRMISCKLHSAERIRAEYGATAAGEATTCARLNRRTLDAVMAHDDRSAEEEDAVQGPGARDARTRPEQATSEAAVAGGLHHGADRCRRHAAHSRQEPGRR